MSWTDEEIDQLYKNSAERVSFEYKNEYWKEMEAMLPEQKGKDFLWFLTSFLFLGIVASGVLLNSTELNEVNESLANEKEATPLIAMVSMEEKEVFGFGIEQKLGPKSARNGSNRSAWERNNHNNLIGIDFPIEIENYLTQTSSETVTDHVLFDPLLLGHEPEMTVEKSRGTFNRNMQEKGIDRLPLDEV